MTTGRRGTYNQIKDLHGRLRGFEIVAQYYLTHSNGTTISKMIDSYSEELMRLTDTWFKKFSTNANCDSVINKEHDKQKFDKMFYCSERVNLYNNIRELFGIICGLKIANKMCNDNCECNPVDTINNLVIKTEADLRAKKRYWKQHYNAVTKNAYELPM